MKRLIKNGWFVVLLCVGLCVVGCASYYKVTDPSSNNVYYTQKVETMRGGAVKVKDSLTGSVVTLQSSAVKEISEKEYVAALAAPVSKPTPTPPAAVPAPTAATAPASAPTATPAPAAAPAPTAAPSPAPGEAPK